MNLSGISFGAEIAAAAGAHHLDPTLLAAVAAQETGGPGSDSGRNVVGDGGHGHGLFQIDDRTWSFASTSAAMDPAKNADAAAAILAGDLQQNGGNVGRALSAYNAGNPNATGTRTTWGDGTTLGYADSVMRHYAGIVADQQPHVLADNRETASSVNALAALGNRSAPIPASIPTASPQFTSPASSAAALAAMPPPLQFPQLSPPAPVPTGSQSQAAANIGAQVDHDGASLVDSGDVFGAASDDDAE